MKDILPPPEELLNLQPEEIGELLLLFLNKSLEKGGRNQFHINNTLNISNTTVSNYIGEITNRDSILLALAEGWSWLFSAGFLSYIPHNDGWVFITRRGREIKTQDDFKNYNHIKLLPKNDLDARLVQKVWSSYIRGDFETAVFSAFKEVEIRIREVGGYSETDIGVKLARKAFNPDNGRLTDPFLEDKGERVAQMELFAGSIGSFKNPASHKDMSFKSPLITASLILLAHTLLRVVEGRRLDIQSGLNEDSDSNNVKS